MNNSSDNESQLKPMPWYKSFYKLVLPMENPEEKKLGYYLSIMFTLCIFVYTSSRLLKDNLIVTELGGDIIPIMKNLVAVFSFFVGGIYMFAATKFNRRTLFNSTLLVLIALLSLFGLVLYPFKEQFFLSAETVGNIMNWLQGDTGIFFNNSKFIKMGITSLGLSGLLSINGFNFHKLMKNFLNVGAVIFGGYSILFYLASPSLALKLELVVKILQIWPYALYYIFSELWGSYALSLLFWNFANYQVKSNESKKIYPFLVLVGQIGQIAAAEIVQRFSHSKHLVTAISLSTLLSGVIIFIVHEYLFKTTGRELESTTAQVKSKKNATFMETLKAVMESKAIMFTTGIVILYGVTCNIIETYWKTRLRELSLMLNPANSEAAKAYFSYNQAAMTKYVGFLSLITALLSGYFLKKMGWKFSALITPLTMLTGGFFFFGLDLFHDIMHSGEGSHVHLLKIAMFFGMGVLVFVKATKYTLFDNTKEIFLVSLPGDIKSQAKVVESFAGRIGKTMGGWILLIPKVFSLALSDVIVRGNIFVLMIVLSLVWIGIVFGMSTLIYQNENS